MINELSRLTKAWLKTHPTYGLTPVLAQLTLAPGDPRPDPPDGIYSDAEDKCVGENIEPDARRSLVIMADGDPSTPVERGLRQYEARRIAVAFLWCVRDVATISARVEGGYILHAVADSLWSLGEGARGGSYRRFGEVELMKWNEFVEVRASGQVGSAEIVAALLATAHVRRIVR